MQRVKQFPSSCSEFKSCHSYHCHSSPTIECNEISTRHTLGLIQLIASLSYNFVALCQCEKSIMVIMYIIKIMVLCIHININFSLSIHVYACTYTGKRAYIYVHISQSTWFFLWGFFWGGDGFIEQLNTVYCGWVAYILQYLCNSDQFFPLCLMYIAFSSTLFSNLLLIINS